MSEYKITVVIPTYNTGDFLKNSFNSILNQTIGFSNIEVIFVDDASTDLETIKNIKEIVNKYDNCKAIFNEINTGFPGTGRNIGLKSAKGEFIIFADHDDSYILDAFEVMYNEINKNNADCVICNFNQVYPDKIIPFNSGFKGKVEFSKDLFQIPAAIWTRLFSRKFLIENNILFLENMLCEDVYVATLSLFKANKIIYLSDYYGYNYSIRDTDRDKSTIHLRNKKYIQSILKGYFEIAKMLDRENKSNYGKLIFKKHLTSWIYTISISELTSDERLELFTKSYPLFVEYYIEDEYFKGKYNKIIKAILNQDYQKAVNESYKINKLLGKVKSCLKSRL